MPTTVTAKPARMSSRWGCRPAIRCGHAEDSRMPTVAGTSDQTGLDRGVAPLLLQEDRDHEEDALQDQPLDGSG